MDKLSQDQKGGNNSVNLQAGRDINFSQTVQADQRDFGIIDEIFKSVIKDLESNESRLDKDHINLSKKIEINFKDEEERRRVQEYFKYAYTKIALIEKRIQEEDSEVQNDLHGHLFQRYNSLKDEGLNNLQILEKLFSQFIIPDKKDNAEYTNLTRAFILFFFDDCTIFEKTESEK
ncbi:MAG: hypothetical protein Q8N08_08740 [Methanobacteriaceae archaeon]|nr:hypothetical protein [Methanobacteriaceae archaeon]